MQLIYICHHTAPAMHMLALCGGAPVAEHTERLGAAGNVTFTADDGTDADECHYAVVLDRFDGGAKWGVYLCIMGIPQKANDIIAGSATALCNGGAGWPTVQEAMQEAMLWAERMDGKTIKVSELHAIYTNADGCNSGQFMLPTAQNQQVADALAEAQHSTLN